MNLYDILGANGQAIFHKSLVKKQVKEVVDLFVGMVEDELQGNKTPLQWEIAQDRNALRAELRTAFKAQLKGKT